MAKSENNDNNATSLQDWREEYAYTLGVQAYIFAYPWVYLPLIRYLWVAQKPNNDMTPYAPLNHFWHSQTVSADYRDGGAPNNDTLYSIAWLDVGTEPVILSHPDMGERYFTFEIASMTSDNFDYVGKRTTGSKAGHFAICGPNWQGDLPKGVQKLAPSPTAAVLIYGRTALKGPEDVMAVKQLQDQYKLTPLGLWEVPDASVPERRDVPPPFDPQNDPLADWKTINQAMIENPPLKQNAFMLDLLKTIGVGPGLDVSKMDPATQKGLARAAQDGRALLQNITVSGHGKRVNGWVFPPNSIGRAGYRKDFITRGAVQCLGGIISNDPEEAIYINTSMDAQGKPLNGANRYILKFETGQLPNVREFWSLTMYDMTFNLVQNPIDRWAIGSLSEDYQLAADGSLTIYIQHQSRGGKKAANWLPAPEGNFFLVFRTYGPSEELISQTWEMPGLMRVE
jgi:hypothetical protein